MHTKQRKVSPSATTVRPFTVYLPEELDIWLRMQAHEHGRTLTAQTVRVLLTGRNVLSAKSSEVA